MLILLLLLSHHHCHRHYFVLLSVLGSNLLLIEMSFIFHSPLSLKTRAFSDKLTLKE